MSKCTLENGTCGFPAKTCVGGNKPGMCGINFEGPGTCSNSNALNKWCWFDKDCGSPNCQPTDPGAGVVQACLGKTEKTCPKDKCKWTGPTCQGDSHHHLNQTCDSLLSNFKKDVKCNQGYEAAVSSSVNYQGRINTNTKKRQPCGFVCNKSTGPKPGPKGLSAVVKVIIGITIAALLAVVIFLIYSEMRKEK